MIKKLIENYQKVEINYVFENEQDLDKILCHIIDFDDENKLLHVEGHSGVEYILPLSVIRKIYIDGTAWKNHR
jgi:hypothetical protein